MSDDPLLQEQLAIASEHFVALVRQAYEAGKRAGENEARARVLMALGADGPSRTAEAKQKPDTSQLTAAAKVSGPLREAIADMNIDQDGADTREITIFIQRRSGAETAMTEKQVRAGLKALLGRGDVARVARGRYRPSDRLLTEMAIDKAEPETEAPNSGTLFGAPKTNGASPLSP
jgi:hypothetical protein